MFAYPVLGFCPGRKARAGEIYLAVRASDLHMKPVYPVRLDRVGVHLAGRSGSGVWRYKGLYVRARTLTTAT